MSRSSGHHLQRDDDVLVRFGGRRWSFRRGDVITVGRARDSVIQLPDDDHLSRRAGSIEILDDCLLVRNKSHHKPLVIRPQAGEDRIVEPGAAATSLPYTRFALVLVGTAGVTLEIDVDLGGLTPACVDEPVTRAPRTVTEPVALGGAQRRILAALCEPLLAESGPRAAPATYAQIGARLNRQPQYVRNVLKALREDLSGYGVTGLTRGDSDSTHDDFRWALARWAIRNGIVTVDDVD